MTQYFCFVIALIYKTETDTDFKNKLKVTKVGGGINQKFGINISLLYIKQITNKDLLYNKGNSTYYSIITIWGKNLEKNECMYMYN